MMPPNEEGEGYAFVKLANGSTESSVNAQEVPNIIPKIEQVFERRSASSTAQDWTNHALEFLSTASNETLGACLVGLSAITYFVLGRIGLILIGTVGGVILHATWEGTSSGDNNGDEDGRAREIRLRHELGLNVVSRVLDWRANDARKTFQLEQDIPNTDVGTSKRREVDYSEFQPATAEALKNLTDAVIRDYVKWWYTPILPKDINFPSTCRQTLTGFIISFSSHLSRKRPTDTFLDFITNSSSIVIVFLNELSNALQASSASAPAAEAVNTYLESNPGSNLANILDARHQRRKLKMVAEDILHSFLDPKAYICEPVRVFLQEILAGVVMEMTVENCSKPEWINGWILFLLEEGDHELMNAIDAGMGGAVDETAMTAKSVNGQAKLNLKEPNGRFDAQMKTTEERKRVTRAKEAMEEALLEAQRLNELIAEEDARLAQQQIKPGDKRYSEASSHMHGIATGTMSSPIPADGDGSSTTPTTRNGSVDSARSRDWPLNDSFSDANSIPSVSTFTSFDQLEPTQPLTALQMNLDKEQTNATPSLTLHNANVSIFDDSMPGERGGLVRNKPTVDYLIQIEPAASQHPGWMIARKYADFETLHEVVSRISVISGVTSFTQQYGTLPYWKGRTKTSLRETLEAYLRQALRYQQLAESEGMKRFLEKEQGLGRASPSTTAKGGFPGIGFPTPAAFETMGKGMLDVLTSAPKGAAEGGKAVFGGVSGVFGGISSLGQKKSTYSLGSTGMSKSGNVLDPSLPRATNADSKERESQEIPRTSRAILTQQVQNPPMPDQANGSESIDQDNRLPALSRARSLSKSSLPSRISGENNRPLSLAESSTSFRVSDSEAEDLHLPPPPSDIPDDYGTTVISSLMSRSHQENSTNSLPVNSATASFQSISPMSNTSPLRSAAPLVPTDTPRKSERKPTVPITEQETQVTVELFFAVINELYTLSSAWNIRRTLLAAAKAFLLRPGNPNLEYIRLLLQGSIIDANTSDDGMAKHISKLRENTMPTEEELKAWPADMTVEEKERLRQKARKLLVEKGMPQALTSIMGAAASKEALGRVFDCLQIELVSKGLMFGLLLQGIRATTQ
ncbi:MAG: hypothetical protein M1827_006287 [Pycnora praestabilis]|nr:MAG: hypothetical protein M1827_006287 [Pycnora praestabilis]